MAVVESVGAGGVARGRKSKDVANGPSPPRGSTVKGEMAMSSVVSSLIKTCPTVFLVSRPVIFLLQLRRGSVGRKPHFYLGQLARGVLM